MAKVKSKKKKQKLLSEQIRVRVTKADHRYLEKKAERGGLTISEVIREAIKKGRNYSDVSEAVILRVKCENLVNHILEKGYCQGDDVIERMVEELCMML